jgi:hypothetical protein
LFGFLKSNKKSIHIINCCIAPISASIGEEDDNKLRSLTGFLSYCFFDSLKTWEEIGSTLNFSIGDVAHELSFCIGFGKMRLTLKEYSINCLKSIV